jgi:hypothetical protein
MFPGWRVEELFERCEDLTAPGGVAGQTIPTAEINQPADISKHQVSRDNSDDPFDLVEWIKGTNTRAEAIESIVRASAYLAEAHTQMPPKKVLAEGAKTSSAYASYSAKRQTAT